jgi:hypothetical protein
MVYTYVLFGVGIIVATISAISIILFDRNDYIGKIITALLRTTLILALALCFIVLIVKLSRDKVATHCGEVNGKTVCIDELETETMFGLIKFGEGKEFRVGFGEQLECREGE